MVPIARSFISSSNSILFHLFTHIKIFFNFRVSWERDAHYFLDGNNTMLKNSLLHSWIIYMRYGWFIFTMFSEFLLISLYFQHPSLRISNRVSDILLNISVFCVSVSLLKWSVIVPFSCFPIIMDNCQNSIFLTGS